MKNTIGNPLCTSYSLFKSLNLFYVQETQVDSNKPLNTEVM